MRFIPVSFAALLVMATTSLTPLGARPPVAGGYSVASATDNEVVAAADFAIKAKTEPSQRLALIAILTAQTQVVAGLNFRLKLKVQANETPKEVEAVVYRHLSGDYQVTAWSWRP